MYDFNTNPNAYNATLSDRSDRMNYGGHSGNPTKTDTTQYTPSTLEYRKVYRESCSAHWGLNGGSCIE